MRRRRRSPSPSAVLGKGVPGSLTVDPVLRRSPLLPWARSARAEGGTRARLARPLPRGALASLHSEPRASLGQLPGLGHMGLGSQCWASPTRAHPPSLHFSTGALGAGRQVPVGRGRWAPAPTEDTGRGACSEEGLCWRAPGSGLRPACPGKTSPARRDRPLPWGRRVPSLPERPLLRPQPGPRPRLSPSARRPSRALCAQDRLRSSRAWWPPACEPASPPCPVSRHPLGSPLPCLATRPPAPPPTVPARPRSPGGFRSPGPGPWPSPSAGQTGVPAPT